MMHKANERGVGVPLPQGLRWAVEMLSGYDLSEVRVYYASDVPAQIGARAITQGTDIHVIAGAEDALPHETWHVVQQMQGRVEPLANMNGMAVNDDPRLEKEADAMGALASRLSWAGMWRRAKGVLAKVRIKKSVVQPQYMMVEGIFYEAVAKPEQKIKSVEDLVKDIGRNTKLSSMPEVEFETIVADLVWEETTFATWAELAKEIEIRRVGYGVETTLRSMLKANVAVDGVFKDFKESLSQLEKDLFDLSVGDAASSTSKDKEIEEMKRKVEELKVKVEEFDQRILRWGANTLPNYSHLDKQMMQWWLGVRKDEPKIMNCWECAFLALVKTTYLNVPKEYMIWAVEQIDTTVALDFNEADIKSRKISRFYTKAVQNMDYYFPRCHGPVLVPSKERFRPKSDETECFSLPEDFIIPRGRLLIFDYASHVAISTGELRPIVTEQAKLRWKRSMGHGVIDLNTLKETLRERTIEDIVCPGACNEQLIVAPFPICTESKTITMRGKVPPTQEEIDAYRRSIDTEAADRYDREIKELATTRDRALQKKGAIPTTIQKRYEAGVRDAQTRRDNAIVRAAKVTSKKIKLISDINPDPKHEVFELRYGPVDPYGGKVTF